MIHTFLYGRLSGLELMTYEESVFLYQKFNIQMHKARFYIETGFVY